MIDIVIADMTRLHRQVNPFKTLLPGRGFNICHCRLAWLFLIRPICHEGFETQIRSFEHIICTDLGRDCDVLVDFSDIHVCSLGVDVDWAIE